MSPKSNKKFMQKMILKTLSSTSKIAASNIHNFFDYDDNNNDIDDDNNYIDNLKIPKYHAFFISDIDESSCTAEDIKNDIGRFNLGDVARIDIMDPTDFNRAGCRSVVIHFSEWFSSPLLNEITDTIEQKGFYKLRLTPSEYWSLSENSNPLSVDTQFFSNIKKSIHFLHCSNINIRNDFLHLERDLIESKKQFNELKSQIHQQADIISSLQADLILLKDSNTKLANENKKFLQNSIDKSTKQHKTDHLSLVKDIHEIHSSLQALHDRINLVESFNQKRIKEETDAKNKKEEKDQDQDQDQDQYYISSLCHSLMTKPYTPTSPLLTPLPQQQKYHQSENIYIPVIY